MDDDGRKLAIVAVSSATALVAGIMTILMGVVGRFPLALAAGLGAGVIAYAVLKLARGRGAGRASAAVRRCPAVRPVLPARPAGVDPVRG